MVLYDPEVASARMTPFVLSEAVADDNAIEPTNEASPTVADISSHVILNIDMESLGTHPLHTHAGDTDGMETDGVDYYNSFFDLHYTRITYKGNFEEDYEVVVEDEFDIEYDLVSLTMVVTTQMETGHRIICQTKMGAWIVILDLKSTS